MKINLAFWKFGKIISLSMFLLLAVFSASAQCVCTDCRCNDSLELVKLYNSTNGANWTVRDTLNTKSPWVLTQPMTTWYGISLTNGRVTWIDLDGIADFNSAGSTGATGNGLSGQLPTLSFSKLTDLFLDVNQLTGSLPHMVLPKIDVLSISFNPQLKGTIPTSWSFPTLQYLDMCHNGLDGTLPTLNFPNLKGLYLQVNKLSGALPTINAPLLADIRMSTNQFTGCFPASYHRFCPFTYAWFGDNAGLPNFTAFCSNFTGICQDTTTCRYKDSTALVAFYYATNGQDWTPKDTIIYGVRKISPWNLNQPMDNWYGIGQNASGCVYCIDLDGNSDYCGAWGDPIDMGLKADSFPTALCRLTELYQLSLRGNKSLGGTLPDSIQVLTKLQYLHLDECSFNAPINTKLWSLPSLLQLSIGGNPLNTTLPSAVGNMKKAIGFVADGSGLIGSIPSAFAQDTALKYLNLSGNELKGIIPLALANVKFQNLGLYYNQLDSFPNFSNASYKNYGWTEWDSGVWVNNNRLTFDDIVPNMRFDSIGNGFVFLYAPQDSIFKDTTITVRVGAPLSIDLKIDGGIPDNVYSWKRNGNSVTSNGSSNLNCFIRNAVSLTDAGVYTCEVKNPRAPDLTLSSRKITVVILPALVDTNSCRYKDSLSLVTFFNNTGGINWTIRDTLVDGIRKISPWKLDQPITTWYGVHLNTEGCVVALDLDGLDDYTWTWRGGNNLKGNLPSVIGDFSKMELLILNGNKGLNGTLPASIGNLKALRAIWLQTCSFSGPLPDALWTLPNLLELDLAANPLNITPPIGIIRLPKLISVILNGCGLYGTIPIEWSSKRLGRLELEYNKIDSMPNISVVSVVADSVPCTSCPKGLLAKNNSLTFSSILPTYENWRRNITITYAPQDSIFKDTTRTVRVGDPLIIDLKIDGAITNNNYKWFKNSVFYKDTNRNKLVFNNLKITDAGVYTCQITNPLATDLTLYSRKITINILPNTSCRYSDSLELVALYNATNGPNWTNKWDLTKPINTWYGVTLNTEGCVTCIDLDGNINCVYTPGITSGNKLSGTLPNLNLPALQALSLHFNNLTGTIPNFSLLPNLTYLGLCQNRFTGSIPTFNLLPKLQTLDLAGNGLSGDIPNFNLSNLTFLSLADNPLGSTIPNFSLPNLKELYLSNDKLIGTIPNFNLPKLELLALSDNQLNNAIPNFNMPNLKELYLYKNQLTSSIPNLNLPNLRALILNDNQLSGCIPQGIKTNCPLITATGGNITNNLNLNTQIWANYWNNGIGACSLIDTTSCRYKDSLQLVIFRSATGGDNWTYKWDLTQPMTTWYGVTLNTEGCVIKVDLYNDRLNGTLPNLDLPNLQVLALGNNQLKGAIPNFNLPALQYLHLFENQLTSAIPNFNLPELQELGLWANQLNNIIPLFDKLTKLKVLGLTGNQLSGSIPNFNLPNLDFLSLDNNKLSGNMPNFTLPKLTKLHLTYNQLMGAIPNLNLPKLQEFWVTDNQLSGCIPQDIKTNCPLITATGGNISNNIGLNTQIWADYWNSGIGACVDTTSCHYKDSLQLVALYNTTGGANWRNQTNWLTKRPINEWYGVYTTSDGCVVSLDFDGGNTNFGDSTSGNNLVGRLPDGIFGLSELTTLYLSGNSGIGSFQNAVARLTKLTNLHIDKCGLTQLPDSLWEMRTLTGLGVSNNTFNIPLPTKIGQLTKLEYLIANNCGWTNESTVSNALATLQTLKSLRYLDLSYNRFNGALSSTIWQMDSLQYLILRGNQLTNLGTGSPQHLILLDVQDNRLKSALDFSNLPIQAGNTDWGGLRLFNNALTFEHILPSKSIANQPNRFFYSPQADIFTNTTITKNVGETVSISLGIDSTLLDNNYRWFKNGIEVPSLFSQKNTLILRGLSACDAGDYKCEVTNPAAPLLTLKSRTIKIVVNGALSSNRLDTAICYGQMYRLPNLQTVSATTSFRDTVKNIRQCDSLIRIVNLTVSPKPDSTVQNAAICFGKTYTLPNGQIVTPSVNTMYRDTILLNGCPSRFRVTNLTVNALPTPIVNDTAICSGNSARLWIRNNSPNFRNYQWQTNSATTASANYIPSVSSTYFVTVTDANGCIGTDSARITVNSKPTAQITNLNNLYCKDNSTVTLQGQPTGGTFRLDGNTALNFNTNTVGIGNHSLNYIYRDVNNCADTTVKTFRIADIARNTINRTICSGDTITINQKKYYKNKLTGIDTLRNASKDGCDSILTVQIAVYPKIRAYDDSTSIGQDKTETTINVLKNDIYPINMIDVNIINKPRIGSIEEKGTGLFNIEMPRAANGFITFNYEICLMGCPNDCDTAMVKVFIKNANPEDLISTAITPNGDGNNDVLDFPEIDWVKYPDARMEIFNRWGQFVFVDDHYKGKWSGLNQNGQDLMKGDYFFILRVSIGEGKIIVGSVYLQR